MTSPDPDIPSIPLDRLDQKLAESRALIAALIKDATASYHMRGAETTAMELATHALYARPDGLASLLATAIITLVENANPEISALAAVDWEALASDAEPTNFVPARNDTDPPENVRLRVKAFLDDLNQLTLKHGIAIDLETSDETNTLRDVTTTEAINDWRYTVGRWELARGFSWNPVTAHYQAADNNPEPRWHIA
jgi:hypothetical protein